MKCKCDCFSDMDNFEFIECLKAGVVDVNKSFRKDLTICMMTYNDAETITACLKALLKQNIICKVIIFDYESKDGTFELLKIQIKNKVYRPLKIELISQKVKGDKYTRKRHFRKNVLKLVKTKYIMFLTANILIPPYSIPLLLEELEKDDKLAMIGLKYEPNVPHVQLGATILRTELVKKIDWHKYLECTCRNAREQLIADGWRIKNHDKLTAIRLSNLLK